MNAVATTSTGSWDHPQRARQVRRESKTSGVAKDEQKILARLRQGDEGAFDELVNKHYGSLIRMAMAYVPDQSIAEEVVQDTWLAAIEGLDRFEGRSSLRTWLFSILIHKAKDRGVREKRHMTFASLGTDEEEGEESAVDPSRFHGTGELAGWWAFPPQPWDDATPEKLLASKEAVDCLQRAIQELPTTLREVLVLRDVEGVESKALCELLSITETNLYVRLHRARERVRQAVEEYLGERPWLM